MPVELDIVVDIGSIVGKNFQVVSNKGLTPGLCGIIHMGITHPNQTRSIVSLYRAVSFICIAVFHAEVNPCIWCTQTNIASHCVSASVPVSKNTGFDFNRAAFVIVFEFKIQHACNSVRTVLRGCAIAQDFHALEGNTRNSGYVWPLCGIGETIAQPVNHGGAMASLAVDEYQRVVGCQSSQIGWSHDGCRIADRLEVDIVRGHDISQ